MATLSIRIPAGLKKKVADMAHEEGVSMNNFICFCLSMGVAQERAAMFFSDRLKGKDRQRVRRRFSEVMSDSREGRPPPQSEIRRITKTK